MMIIIIGQIALRSMRHKYGNKPLTRAIIPIIIKTTPTITIILDLSMGCVAVASINSTL